MMQASSRRRLVAVHALSAFADSLLPPSSALLSRCVHYVGFSGLMNFSFCFTAVAVTASISVMFEYGLGTGGPAVMIWGWIIACCFTMFIGCALAEIAATYPSAGSVYHWAGQLAPLEWAPFTSFICGWLN